jgi:hypothetical protein
MFLRHLLGLPTELVDACSAALPKDRKQCEDEVCLFENRALAIDPGEYLCNRFLGEIRYYLQGIEPTFPF